VVEAMPDAPDYAAVRIDVRAVKDHRQPAFRLTAGVDREWRDADEQAALGRRVDALRVLATAER
jgi:hypothetical protein